jgi:hypothetical protein
LVLEGTPERTRRWICKGHLKFHIKQTFLTQNKYILLWRLRPNDGYSQWPKHVAIFRHLRIYVVLMDSLLMLL